MVKSLRSRVFGWLDSRLESEEVSLQKTVENFKEESYDTVKRYFYAWKVRDSGDVILFYDEIDTIKQMRISIGKIRNAAKRCDAIAKLHNMLLKPIVNKEEKTLTEIFLSS